MHNVCIKLLILSKIPFQSVKFTRTVTHSQHAHEHTLNDFASNYTRQFKFTSFAIFYQSAFEGCVWAGWVFEYKTHYCTETQIETFQRREEERLRNCGIHFIMDVVKKLKIS